MEEEGKWDAHKDLYQQDLLKLFKHIIRNALEEINSPQTHYMVVIGFITSITNIIDRCGKTLCSMPEFTQILSGDLISLLGPLILTFHPKCLKNACHLLLSLFKRFRHLLKKELYVILDVVIISTIRSATSAFYQKHYLLNLICNLLSQPDILADIFTNYDCCPGYGNTLGKIFESLCRIGLPSRDFERSIQHGEKRTDHTERV